MLRRFRCVHIFLKKNNNVCDFVLFCFFALVFTVFVFCLQYRRVRYGSCFCFIILLFHFIVVSLSLSCFSLAVCRISYPFLLELYSLLLGLPFLRSLLTRMSFLPYMWLSFVCVFCFSFCLFFVCFYSFLFFVFSVCVPSRRRCPLPSLPGTFLVRSVLSAFPVFFSERVSGLIFLFRPSCDHGWIRSGSIK